MGCVTMSVLLYYDNKNNVGICEPECVEQIDYWQLSNDLRAYYDGKRGEFVYKDSLRILYGLDAMNRVVNIFENIKQMGKKLNRSCKVDTRLLSVIYDHKKILEHMFILLIDDGIMFEYKNIADKLKENVCMAGECLDLLERYNGKRDIADGEQGNLVDGGQRRFEDIGLIQERLRKIVCVEDVVIPVIIDGIEEKKRQLMKLERVEDIL